MKMTDAKTLQETRLDSETLFSGKILHVKRDRVRLPNGNESEREYVQHPGAVLVVPQLEDGRLVLVRQFRYPVGQVVLEFPAGRCEPNEAPLLSGQRELREETGYVAGEWQALGVIDLCVGYSDERIHVFCAQGLTQHGAQPDPDEFVETVLWEPTALLEAVASGAVTDGKTLSALLLWQTSKH